MTHTLRSATIAVALLGSAGLAVAGGDKASGSSSNTQMQGGATGQASGSMSTGSSMSKGGATTQATLNLTSQQKQTIARELSREEPAADESFQAAIGAKVPPSIALKPVPMSVANDIIAAKNYSYAKLQNEDIVLVNPTERTVVAVIDSSMSSSTTGSAPSTTGSAPSGSMQRN